MKNPKIVRIDDSLALDHIARCEVYQAIDDYEVWSRILRKDPCDPDARYMLDDCEEFIMNDPRAKRCIRDPEKLLRQLDRIAEQEYKKWVKKCSQ